MTLGEKQRLFVKLQAKFVTWAYAHGYELTDGDAYRDPRLFGKVGVKKGYGRSRSNHKIRLAKDYNLFKKVGGKWVYQRSTKAHEPLGLYWESLHPLCTWGGRFKDGNHYSMEHQGRR